MRDAKRALYEDPLLLFNTVLLVAGAGFEPTTSGL